MYGGREVLKFLTYSYVRRNEGRGLRLTLSDKVGMEEGWLYFLFLPLASYVTLAPPSHPLHLRPSLLPSEA